MGVDYIARKSAKKRKKKERQAVGKDGVARRERRRKKVRRLCQGVCYKAPELTEEDKRWSDAEQELDAPAYDSDIEEAAERAKSHHAASTSAAEAEASKQPPAKKRKRAEAKPKAGATVLSTSVQLLDPAALAHNARQAALRKLPAGAKADALEGFPPLLQACMLTQHLVEPTPIQERCWPPALAGRDVQGVAEPGSGKTLAYLLPGLVKLQAEGHNAVSRPEGPVMLVLLPTRELAQQVAAQCRHTRAVTGLRTVCVFGGAPREEQAALLSEKQPHVLVATPGRLLDLVDGGELKLQGNVRYLVLDEADKMLSLGFKPQLDRLYDMLLRPHEAAAATTATAAANGGDAAPGKKGKKAKSQAKKQHDEDEKPQQNGAAAVASAAGAAVTSGRPQVLLFSATMPGDVTSAAAQWLLRPEVVRISASGANAISRTITQVVHVCAEHKKPDKLLKHLARIREATPAGSRNPPRVLVFANRVKTVRFLAATLSKEGYKAVQLHGQRSQAERNQAVSDFRSGKGQVLVATDVAARGLDIRALPYVVNYDFPSRLETYVHRVGRTGRLAAYGHSYSFFTRNLAPLAPPLLELLQAHEQAVDPNLAALAAAWRVAEDKLGGGGAAAAAALRMGESGPDGGGGDEDEDDGGEDDEGDASAAAAAAAAGEGLSLAEQVLGAAEDLMEGLGPQDARAIAALLRKKMSRQQHQKQQQEQGDKTAAVEAADGEVEGAEGADNGRGGKPPGKKQRREAEDGPVGQRTVVRPGDAQMVPTTKEQRVAMAKQQHAQQAGGERPAAFMPSKKFNGAMAGYAFKRGPLGLGYYPDPHQKQQDQKQMHPKQGAAAGKGKGQSASAAGDSTGKAGAAAAAGKVATAAAAGKAQAGGKLSSASAWGLPTRNKPIIPVRHSDFLSSDEEEKGGGGGRKGDESSSDGGSDDGMFESGPSSESEPESDEPPRAGGRHGGLGAGAAGRLHQNGVTRKGLPVRNRAGGGGDGEGSDEGGVRDSEDEDDEFPEGGLRAVAKQRHKALPGRLRKKLAKMQGQGQDKGQGQQRAGRPGQGRPGQLGREKGGKGADGGGGGGGGRITQTQQGAGSGGEGKQQVGRHSPGSRPKTAAGRR